MKVLILSDLHLNPRRQAGTTLHSREAMEEWILRMMEHSIEVISHDIVVINGDLFDRKSVSEKTLLRVYNILKDQEVILVRGNHDSNSMEFGNICSLELLGSLLPKCTLVYDKPYSTTEGLYFIPHCFNQEEFDKCVEEAPEFHYIFIHANNDNHFSLEADHSLNLSSTQKDRLEEKGCTVFLGHEHSAAKEGEDFHILGCHAPTSIADCLSGNKYAYVLDTNTDEIEKHETWSQDEGYIEMDCHDIYHSDTEFIRIVGTCTSEEYPEVVRNISKLRKESEAFVIGSKVDVQVDEVNKVVNEDVTNFNVISLLLGMVEEEYKKEVESCV